MTRGGHLERGRSKEEMIFSPIFDHNPLVLMLGWWLYDAPQEDVELLRRLEDEVAELLDRQIPRQESATFVRVCSSAATLRLLGLEWEEVWQVLVESERQAGDWRWREFSPHSSWTKERRKLQEKFWREGYDRLLEALVNKGLAEGLRGALQDEDIRRLRSEVRRVLFPLFSSRWRDFKSGEYAREAKKFEKLTGMEVDKLRPPFICAGNLEDRHSKKIITFGLAPHSRSEPIPGSPEDYYRGRVDYFNTDSMPHHLHGYFAHMCWGILGISPPGKQERALWLHNNGYLTFDLVPYYVKKWKPPNWKDDEIFRIVRNHFRSCMGLLKGHAIRLALFSGKAWEELLVFSQSSRRVCEFKVELSFPLSKVTGKGHQRCQVHAGELSLEDHPTPIRAVIIGHLLPAIWGFSHSDALNLGRHIRNF